MRLLFVVASLLMQALVLVTVQAADNQHQHHKPTPAMDQKDALAYSQAAIGKSVGDYVFLNTHGQQVRLTSMQGRPVVISMIYTSCYHICPTVTQHLADVVKKAKHALGEKSFSVLTIGFDTANDTPNAMRVFAAQQGADSTNWQFLSADKKTITALSKDLGFQFHVSTKGFDHLIQATIVDAEGKVYRQVYDMNFRTPLLIEPLKELLEGQPRQGGSLLGHLGNKIRLFCTVYDPRKDRYYVDYSVFMGIFIGLTSLGFIGFFLFRVWRSGQQADD